jgi:hypothetical protein
MRQYSQLFCLGLQIWISICMRLQDNEGMNQRVQMEVDDPRRFSVHLAPIPQPPTQESWNIGI